MLGREIGRTGRPRGAGYDYLHVAIDDSSRAVVVGVYPDERGETAARFLLEAAAFFASHGVRIQEIITDRAFAYTHSRDPSPEGRSPVCRPAILSLGPIALRPTARRNASSRRCSASGLTAGSTAPTSPSGEGLDALPRWLRFYNERRPHAALEGRSPMTTLVNNVCGNDT